MIADSSVRTLCFLFTDIEGSTRLWERLPGIMPAALAQHDDILRDAVTRCGGTIVKTTGDGLMAVFATASDAVAACLDAQLALARATWPETGPLRVRMGLHVGQASAIDDDYRGPAVNRAARIMAAGHGGQVLLSAVTAALVADDLPDGTDLIDLGEHRLKDLGRAERVMQLAHAGLPRDFPALVTLDAHLTRLPAEPSAFVGREAILAGIVERLRSDAVRLLTLIGPGGIGKTRLALRAAHELESAFANAVAFVDLSEVRDPDAVLTSIARAIGQADAGETSAFDELVERLGDRSMLLVLDNFEQVSAAAPTIARLLQACPRLTVLVTSREALRVRGEHLLEVPTLSLPDAGLRSRGASAMSATAIARSEAVRLFVERARAIRPDFELTDENAPVIAEICLRLDGLPLAIELATARIGVFSVAALRDRLGQRLSLLRSGARDLPERQQTLRATIEWSYQLLDPGEQRVFELMASFAGAGVDAVEGVARGLDGRLAGVDTLDALLSLVGKSLVRQSSPGVGEPRFDMLETIREYASERLSESPDVSAATRHAHAAWYATFAAEQVPRLDGAERDRAIDLLAADLDNLRASWRYWVEERDVERLDGLIDALWPVFEAKGWYRATIELARDVLGSSTPCPPRRSGHR